MSQKAEGKAMMSRSNHFLFFIRVQRYCPGGKQTNVWAGEVGFSGAFDGLRHRDKLRHRAGAL
jgi:hypothetical protein